MKKALTFSMLAITMLVIGCSSVKVAVTYEYDQSVDFRPYKTNPLDTRHGMEPGIKTDEDGQVLQPDQHGVSTVPAEHTITAFQVEKYSIQSKISKHLQMFYKLLKKLQKKSVEKRLA